MPVGRRLTGRTGGGASRATIGRSNPVLNCIAPVAFHSLRSTWHALQHQERATMPAMKHVIRTAGAVCLAILLSECVIVPA
jgi:hypothetical protein